MNHRRESTEEYRKRDLSKLRAAILPALVVLLWGAAATGLAAYIEMHTTQGVQAKAIETLECSTKEHGEDLKTLRKEVLDELRNNNKLMWDLKNDIQNLLDRDPR